MNLTDLQAFIRVVDTGSFTAAGQALGVPTSTVSRRVARLEEELGTQLVLRSGRSFTVTERGQLVYGRAAPALLEIREVERALTDVKAVPQGLLRITAPPDIATTRPFCDMLAAFRERHPAVHVELDLSVRAVDLVAEQFDVAFRAGMQSAPEGTGLMARGVATIHAGLFASPDYLQRRGIPESCSEDHIYLGHSRAQPGDSPLAVPIDAAIRANDFGVLRWLALAGAGLALLPVFAVVDDVAEGRLVQVMKDRVEPQGRLWMVWPEARFLSPRVRAFLDHVSERVDSGEFIAR